MRKPSGRPTGRPRNPEVDRLAALLGMDIGKAVYLGAKQLKWRMGKEERAKNFAADRSEARRIREEDEKIRQEELRVEARRLFLVASRAKTSKRVERMMELSSKRRLA